MVVWFCCLMQIVCWLLLARCCCFVCRLLFDEYRVLHGVPCLRVVICWLLLVVCSMCSLYVVTVCCELFLVWWFLLSVMCYVLFVMCCLFCVVLFRIICLCCLLFVFVE